MEMYFDDYLQYIPKNVQYDPIFVPPHKYVIYMHRETDRKLQIQQNVSILWVVKLSDSLSILCFSLFKFSTMNIFCFCNKKQINFFQKEKQ